MMSPNRAMAQAGSVGVIDTRPGILYNGERIENFDITTRTDGHVNRFGNLELLRGDKYIAPDGVTYTCFNGGVCWITPTEGGGGYASRLSKFTITYPDDIGSSNQAAADAVDDIVADDSPRLLVNGEIIEHFDVTTATEGDVVGGPSTGLLTLSQGQKYTALDGTVYTCASKDKCLILQRGTSGLIVAL